jgi:predicted DNA binding CopG/RHH family protein
MLEERNNMDESSESFEKDLEQLIRLFKKIRTNSQNEQFSHLDKAFTQNLDFIINNYEMVKNNIPKEMLSQMGLPFQKMLHEFIDQLKAELGEEIYEEETKSLINEDNKKVLENDIEQIDILLKRPGLSEEELNHLLDKRNEIINKRLNNLLTGI